VLLKKQIIQTELPISEHAEYVAKIGDFAHDYTLTYPKWELNTKGCEWSILAIVGQSGTGKTGLLQQLKQNQYEQPQWDDRPIIEHIHRSPELASKWLGSVGMNTLPTWLKKYSVLSMGEKYRTMVAWLLARQDNLYFDEYTSTLDRDSAMSLSISLHKTIKRENKRLVVATCHRDILDHLKPCYVIDLDKEQVFDTRGWQRQSRTIELVKCDRGYWRHFAPYHYLTNEIPNHTQTFLVRWKETGKIIGFTSCHTLPSGTMQNAYIASRTVCLPQFQGMGFGTRITELLAQYMVGMGKRFFSKTSHPTMGMYREKSDKWKPTSKNKKERKDYSTSKGDFYQRVGREQWEIKRVAYSHEYVGGTTWVDTSPQQLSLF
jgi:ABC-type lipoprotein export system ATPase subunit